MKNNSTVIPVPRQVVKIKRSDNCFVGINLFSVVDVVTLDGRLKLFSLDDLKIIELKEGLRIDLEYEQEDALYRSSWIIDYLEYGNLSDDRPSLLLLSPDQKINRIQRRNCFRLSVLLDIRFKIVVLPENFTKNLNLKNEMIQSWQIERKFFPHFGRIVDISEGGLCFISDTKMERGDQIVLDLILQDKSLLLPSVVVWKSFTDISDTMFHKMGVKFVGVRMKEKTKIQKLICSEQRKQIKRKIVF